MNKKDYYKQILNTESGFNFTLPAEHTATIFADTNPTFRDTTLFCTAPTLISYVMWVLTDAVKNNIHNLFFLARDGLVMYKIAAVLCAAWNLPITYKYLYISRYVLEPENVEPDTVKSYLRQELPERDTFAIVDTGWSGTVHSNIAKLLERPITGYYFGMFKKGNPLYGTFNTFLFHSGRQMFRYPLFCNNLFECLCAADHGMTIGYKQVNTKWEPIFANYEQITTDTDWSAKQQLSMCETYAVNFAEMNNVLFHFNVNRLRHMVKALMLNLMGNPSISEATVFGSIPFNAEADVSTILPLAYAEKREELRKHTLLPQLLKALRGQRGRSQASPIYWSGGTLTLSNAKNMKKDFQILQTLYFWMMK